MIKMYKLCVITLLMIIISCLAVFSVKASDIADVFEENIPNGDLTLGETYIYQLNINIDSVDEVYLIISYDPSKISFTKYELNEYLKIKNYNNDVVTGTLVLNFEKNSELLSKELFKLYFIPLVINAVNFEVSYLSYQLNDQNIILNGNEYQFNVVDLYEYDEFIKAVKSINSQKLLFEYGKIKEAEELMKNFNKEIVSTDAAKQAVRLLEQYIKSYNAIIETLNDVSNKADIVSGFVGGK